MRIVMASLHTLFVYCLCYVLAIIVDAIGWYSGSFTDAFQGILLGYLLMAVYRDEKG